MKATAGQVSIDRGRDGRRVALAIGAVAAVVVVGMIQGGYGSRLPPMHLHGPEFARLAAAPLQVQLHLAAVLIALGIGTVLMLGMKGRTMHRVLGWVWVVAMATGVISSLFIKTAFGPGHFGLIHLLSGWSAIALPMAVWFIKRKEVARHRRMMMGLFYGGLVLAGGLAFLPGRLMWGMFFG